MIEDLNLAGPASLQEDPLIYQQSMHAPDDLKKPVVYISDQNRQC